MFEKPMPDSSVDPHLPSAPLSQPAIQGPSPNAIFLACMLAILLSFTSVYTVAWLGYRANPEVQGTYTPQLALKFYLLDNEAKEYKERYGQYPPSLLHLLAKLEPREKNDDPALAYNLLGSTYDFMTIDPWGKRFQYSLVEENTYILKSFGRDGKDGGIGINADITMGDQPGLQTMPTFWQFLFEIEYSSTFFKVSICLSLIAILAFQLQLKRKSAALTSKRFIFNFLILVPCCIIVAAWLTIGHLMPETHAH